MVRKTSKKDDPVITDSTELKHTMEELRLTEEKFRVFFEKSSAALAIIEPDTTISMVNDAYCQMGGYSKEEVIGMSWTRQIPPGDLERLMEYNRRRLMNPEDAPDRYEFRFNHRDGSLRYAIMSVAMIPGTRKVITSFTDITDRRIAEESLRISEEKFSKAFRNIPDVIIITALPEGIILDVNDGLFRVAGYRREEVVDKSTLYLHMWNVEEDRATFIRMLGEKGRVTEFETTFRKKTGEIFTGLISGEIIMLQEKKCVLSVVHDISERRLAEEKIARMNEELEERVIRRTKELEVANKEMEAFSYSISHDLRAPLRAIAGFSHLLKEDYGNNLEPGAGKLLTDILENVKRMGQLIEDLLSFSRTSRKEIAISELDMEQLFTGVFSELKSQQGRPGILLSMENLPHANGDKNLVRQVVTNLLSNAIKFTGHCEKPWIRVSGTDYDDECRYTVIDNGVGFDMQYAGKLFGVFQRFHAQQEYEGTGVGLAIVHNIITRHGGHVWAESEPGKGATFYFTLPKNSPGKGA
ncbi:MAG: PAS domain S-box protein [bacterium]